MIKLLVSFVLLLCLIGYSYGECHCGDKMVYFFSQPNQQINDYYLYSYNLTSGEQVSIIKVANGASYTDLYYASENKQKAIFSAPNLNGLNGQDVSVQFDLNNSTVETLGHSPIPNSNTFQVCSNSYNRHENVGYKIIYNPVSNEFGLYTSNFNTSSGVYVKKGYSQGCPYVSVPKDFKSFYLIVNTTTAIIINTGDNVIATYFLVGYSNFINNASIIPIGIISEFQGNIYGAAYTPTSQTSTAIYIYKLDLVSMVFEVIYDYTESVVINPNFPDAMFSSDGSHVMLMLTVNGEQQVLIYSFVISKSFFLKPTDAFPTSAISYYLVYDAPILPNYPEKSVVGVTFGYGIPVILLLAGVVFVMYRNDFATLLEGARNWEHAKLQRFSNIVFFFVASIKLTVVYVLAEEINTPGLAVAATFMELHKAMFGIFTSLFYRAKLLPIYYLLSALSIVFHFVTFITAFIHNGNLVLADKNGVHFYKALTFLTFFFSVAYLIYLFIKVRKSDPTSSNNYRSSVSARDDISYNPILNNDNYDDDE